MFRCTKSLSLLAAALLALGCGEKDSSDGAGFYGITEGHLDISKLKYTGAGEVIALSEYSASQCLARRTAYVTGAGPTMSLSLEKVCDFVAQYRGDGKFETFDKLCPLALNKVADPDTSGGLERIGNLSLCFGKQTGTAKDGSLQITMQGSVVLDFILDTPQRDCGVAMGTAAADPSAPSAECEEFERIDIGLPPTQVMGGKPFIESGLWVCYPNKTAADPMAKGGKCRKKITSQLEQRDAITEEVLTQTCDTLDERLIVGTVELTIGKAKDGLAFFPDCNVDSTVELIPQSESCKEDGDCPGPKGAVRKCNPPMAAMTMTPVEYCRTHSDCQCARTAAPACGPAREQDKCGQLRPNCKPTPTATCDSLSKPGTDPQDSRCPNDPELGGNSPCEPDVTPQDCTMDDSVCGDRDCVDDPSPVPQVCKTKAGMVTDVECNRDECMPADDCFTCVDDPKHKKPRFCVDRYRCRVRTVPVSDGCGCFNDTCVEFTACR